jgi:Ni/Co efflux regulator RcnB
MIRLPIDTPALAKGGHMKRLVLLLVVAAFAASPAAAASKHKKSEQTAEAKQAAEAEDIAKQHDNTRRALRDALPLVLPSWSLPFFFGMHLDEKMKNETKNEKKKKQKAVDRQ